MVVWALEQLNPSPGALLFIGIVGNPACPALFDLGACAEVAICSAAESDDKPVKYPHMFRAGSLMILSKIDLLPHVPFDIDRCLDFASAVNPSLRIIRPSAMCGGDGLVDWYTRLREQSQDRWATASWVPSPRSQATTTLSLRSIE